MRRLISAIIMLATSAAAFAQSQDFKNGVSLEVHQAIIKELLSGYVDTVKVDEIVGYGIEAMLERLDPYTIYVPEEDQEGLEMMLSGTYGGIGAIIFKRPGEGVIINEPYEGSPAVEAGLRCGDMILEIDGKEVYDLESGQCSERMKGKPGTKVHFKVKKVRTGDTVEVDIVRKRIQLKNVQYAGMLDDSTGYILLTGFTEGASQQVRKEISGLKAQGMKRLVLDLRGNGGGAMIEAVGIASAFLPKNTLVVSAKGRSRSMANTEYRTFEEPLDTEMPLMVMIDGGSASSSEIVAGAIQDLDRGVIMGNKSFGKGLVQSIRPLPYNGQLKVTTARYYTPSGRCVQALDYSHRNADGTVGSVPDSLKKEFRTAAGRIVRDGGGITPDVEIPYQKFSRVIYSLVLNGIIDEYTLDYVARHDSIPPVEEFHLSDEDFEDFISFAAKKDFDYRSTSKALFDQMKKDIEEDGMDGLVKEELDALEKAMDVSKEEILRYNKNDIVPFIEEQIAVRYYFKPAGIKVRLRTDKQLKEALEKWDTSILKPQEDKAE